MRRAALLAPLLLVALLALGRQQPLTADGPTAVAVTNFPPVQKVNGTVLVPAPIPTTRLEQLAALVSPGQRADPLSYVEAGTLDATGFGAVTLGIAGEVQGRLLASAPVGVILLPDEPEIVGVFRTHGILQFALEVETQVAPGVPGIFSSEQAHLRLGFPRYRVLLYNGSPKTTEVTVYAYLNNA